MQILAVPNWSFGRDPNGVAQFRDSLKRERVTVHYCQADPDHHRTVTAFSGDLDAVRAGLMNLCRIAFAQIDLGQHVGVHPRIGALDVCPFVPLSGSTDLALRFAEEVAAEVAGRFEVPVYLYEQSERGHHAADLPTLRRGGFAGLHGRHLSPDFGPSHAHPCLGVTVMGVRRFLIALNVNLEEADPAPAKQIARAIRNDRDEGDPRFQGVRALGFPLASKGQSQVSINMTEPDLTSVDFVVDWVKHEADRRHLRVAGTELIGVIRQRDLATATSLCVDPAQVIL